MSISFTPDIPDLDSVAFDDIGFHHTASSEHRVASSFENSLLHRDWAKNVKFGTPNDFVMCITASSRTPVSGTGKTTLETDLAQYCDLSPEGFDAKQKASLDAGELAYEIVHQVNSQSAVVWDEAQGAPGTVGLDSRRAMKQESIDAISAILANRDKQLTIIITAQIFSMLDPRIYPIIDGWLLIRKEPDHPDGPLGTYHQVFVEDYDLKNPKVKTPAVEDFRWPMVPHDDPDYVELERLKQLAKSKDNDNGSSEGDGKLPKSAQVSIAQAYRDNGRPLQWIAENVDEVTYSHEWVRQNTVENRDVESQDAEAD